MEDVRGGGYKRWVEGRWMMGVENWRRLERRCESVFGRTADLNGPSEERWKVMEILLKNDREKNIHSSGSTATTKQNSRRSKKRREKNMLPTHRFIS